MTHGARVEGSAIARMRKSRTRADRFLVAATAGSALVILVLVGLVCRVPERIRVWSQWTTLPVLDVEHGEQPTLDEFRVLRAPSIDQEVPLVSKDVSWSRAVIEAKYSSHWAERRVISITGLGGSVTVRASFDTDYGLLPGVVDPASSTIRRSARGIAFDLGVESVEPSSRRERWVGRITYEE